MIRSDTVRTVFRYAVATPMSLVAPLVNLVPLLSGKLAGRNFVRMILDASAQTLGLDPIPVVEANNLGRPWGMDSESASISIPFYDRAAIDPWHGSSSVVQQMCLSTLVSLIQPRRILEIGTFMGFTTLWFAMNGPSDVRVFTLDLPPEEDAEPTRISDARLTRWRQEAALAYEGTPHAARIVQLWGDSATFDFEGLGEVFEFVYIDGAHSLEYVLGDTRKTLRVLHPSGVLCWDDYEAQAWVGHADVGRFLRRFHKEVAPLTRVSGTKMVLLKCSSGETGTPAEVLEAMERVWPQSCAS